MQKEALTSGAYTSIPTPTQHTHTWAHKYLVRRFGSCHVQEETGAVSAPGTHKPSR